MTRAVLILNSEGVRERARSWIAEAPPGTRLEFKAPRRSLEQSSKMWAMLTEVATQVDWHGQKLTADDWKLVFLAALRRETRIVPNLDGDGFVNLSTSSSDLSKGEMSDLIELMMAFGAQHSVKFNDPQAVA